MEQAKKLLRLYDVSLQGKQLLSFHTYTDHERVYTMLGKATQDEQDVLCISDAGTP